MRMRMCILCVRRHVRFTSKPWASIINTIIITIKFLSKHHQHIDESIHLRLDKRFNVDENVCSQRYVNINGYEFEFLSKESLRKILNWFGKGIHDTVLTWYLNVWRCHNRCFQKLFYLQSTILIFRLQVPERGILRRFCFAIIGLCPLPIRKHLFPPTLYITEMKFASVVDAEMCTPSFSSLISKWIVLKIKYRKNNFKNNKCIEERTAERIRCMEFLRM